MKDIFFNRTKIGKDLSGGGWEDNGWGRIVTPSVEQEYNCTKVQYKL